MDGGEVKLSPDMTEFAWVSLEQARQYDLIEGIYEELNMLDAILKNQADSTGKETKQQ